MGRTLAKPQGDPASRTATFEIVEEFRATMNPDDRAAFLKDSNGRHWLAFNGEAYSLLGAVISGAGRRLSAARDLIRMKLDDQSLDAQCRDLAVDELLDAVNDGIEILQWPFNSRENCPSLPPAKTIGGESEVPA